MRTVFAFATLATVLGSPLAAQTAQIDARVGKLEKEMRAVQRSVFPQGVPVQPDLTAPQLPTTAAGAPASAPIADLMIRIDALERQLATLTGASEQNGFKVRQLEDALTRIQARLTTLENAAPSSGVTVPSASIGGPSPAGLAATGDTTRVAASTTTRPSARPAVATRVDPARRDAVGGVEMPDTGDAVEDAYTYGFRLYTAKLYPEAQARLKEFTAKQPVTARRWSYAQNLLGRAYLDEGKPALASVAFYDNYQKAPRGERAAESLTWLGLALTRLKKTADACKVYAELDEVYGTRLSAEQKARAAKGRADAKCAA